MSSYTPPPRRRTHTAASPPKIIPPNPEDKVTVDSMLERMQKVQEYDDKIKVLRNTREGLVDAIGKIDVLILDYMKLKKGIE